MQLKLLGHGVGSAALQLLAQPQTPLAAAGSVCSKLFQPSQVVSLMSAADRGTTVQSAQGIHSLHCSAAPQLITIEAAAPFNKLRLQQALPTCMKNVCATFSFHMSCSLQNSADCLNSCSSALYAPCSHKMDPMAISTTTAATRARQAKAVTRW
jgi:hypothetical protein